MKITSIRHDKDAGREMMTVYDADVLMEKMKTEIQPLHGLSMVCLLQNIPCLFKKN